MGALPFIIRAKRAGVWARTKDHLGAPYIERRTIENRCSIWTRNTYPCVDIRL